MFVHIFCFAMCDINSMSRWTALAQNRRNSGPCTIKGLPDKDYPIKGFIVCNDWDLEPFDILNGLALDCYQPSLEV